MPNADLRSPSEAKDRGVQVETINGERSAIYDPRRFEGKVQRSPRVVENGYTRTSISEEANLRNRNVARKNSHLDIEQVQSPSPKIFQLQQYVAFQHLGCHLDFHPL